MKKQALRNPLNMLMLGLPTWGKSIEYGNAWTIIDHLGWTLMQTCVWVWANIYIHSIIMNHIWGPQKYDYWPSPPKHWICQFLDYNRPPLLDTNANPCMSLSQHLHPLYMISRELTSLFVHYYKGYVLEYLPGLVDLNVKLNLHDKQRGALSKLQHFLGNRISRDILILVLMYM